MSSLNHETQIKNWIQLRHDDLDTAGVMVTPEDEDRFPLTMELAIEGCRFVGQIENFNRQLKSLLGRLAKWAAAHEDEIDQLHVAFRGSEILFLVIQKSKSFNETLENELVNLDIEIAQNSDYELIRMNILSLPDSSEETVRSFLPKRYWTYKNAGRTDTSRDRQSQPASD